MCNYMSIDECMTKLQSGREFVTGTQTDRQIGQKLYAPQSQIEGGISTRNPRILKVHLDFRSGELKTNKRALRALGRSPDKSAIKLISPKGKAILTMGIII